MACCGGAAVNLIIVCVFSVVVDRIKADKGLPQMFERYNGKPTLMTKSSRIVQGPGYFEMDVSEPPHTLTTHTHAHNQMRTATKFINRET